MGYEFGILWFTHVFQYKDHLCNVRLNYSDHNLDGSINPSSEILEESNYYPFGLEHKGYNMNKSSFRNALAQQWKFGGKEYQEELDLDWYDISARNYDPALGRWMNIDPLAEDMRRHSPYNYAFDNPIYWMDPDGMAPQANDCCGNNLPKITPINPIALGQSAYRGAKGIGEGIKTAGAFLEGLMVDGYNLISARGTNKNQRKGPNNSKTINVDDLIPMMPSSVKSLNAKGSIVKKLFEGANDGAEAISNTDKAISIIESNATKEVDKDTTVTRDSFESFEFLKNNISNSGGVSIFKPGSSTFTVNKTSLDSLDNALNSQNSATMSKSNKLQDEEIERKRDE